MGRVKSKTYSRVQYNEQLLVWEGIISNFGVWIVWSYVSILAIYLGASDLEVGLLSSLPALVTMLAMIPLTRIAQGRPRQKMIAAACAFGNRGFYLLLAILPLLGLLTPKLLIIIVVIMAVPGALLNVVWADLQSRLFPPEQRAGILGFRNAVCKVAAIVATFLGGYFIEVVGYPTNYSVLFAVAFALCMIGVYLVTRIDEVDHSGDDGQAEPSQDIPYFKQLKAIVTDEEYGRKFIVFTISMFVFHFGMNTTASVWPIYHVRELGLSTTVIGIFNSASGVLSAIGFWYLGRVAAKRGDDFVLTVSVLGNAIFPLVYSFFPNVLVMTLLQSWVGFWNAGWSLTIYTILLNSSKDQYRSACIATFHTLMSVTGFISPMFGTFLLAHMPGHMALRVSSAIRILGWLILVFGMRALEGTSRPTGRSAVRVRIPRRG